MARPVKGVSALAFKIVKKAIKIRIDRGEEFDEILESYPKLSQSQADEAYEEFKDYKSE